MNVLSLFSGIGGLDLGLERAGMTVVGQVEIDPWCRKVLAKHWPEVPRHDDVRTCADWWAVDRRPVVDLICGGVPCQPVSSAGKRLAQADERWLWPVTIETIGRLRPRYALLENVPGLLVRGMGDVLGDLAQVGYDAEWDCVSASALGAPHQRDRVWIVAYPQNRQQPQLAEGAHDAGPPIIDRAGAGGRAGGGSASPRVRELGRGATSGPEAVADTSGELPRHGHDGKGPVFPQRPQGHEGLRRALSDPDHWVTEPDVGRVAHGIPHRVDRLRGLGNAVVPQVAEHIGRMILAAP